MNGRLLQGILGFAVFIIGLSWFLYEDAAPDLTLNAYVPQVVHTHQIPITASAPRATVYAQASEMDMPGVSLSLQGNSTLSVAKDGTYVVRVTAVRQPYMGLGDLFGFARTEKVERLFRVVVDTTAPTVSLSSIFPDPASQVMVVTGTATDSNGIGSIESIFGNSTTVDENGQFSLSIPYVELNAIKAFDMVEVRVIDRTGLQVRQPVQVTFPATRVERFAFGAVRSEVITQPGFTPNALNAHLWGNQYRVYVDGTKVSTVGWGFPFIVVPVFGTLFAGAYALYLKYKEQVDRWIRKQLIRVGLRKQTSTAVAVRNPAIAQKLALTRQIAEQTAGWEGVVLALNKLTERGTPQNDLQYALFFGLLQPAEQAVLKEAFAKVYAVEQMTKREVSHEW